MVVCVVALKYFVQTLCEERPKAVHGTVIIDLIKDVSNKVKVRLYLFAVYLGHNFSTYSIGDAL